MPFIGLNVFSFIAPLTVQLSFVHRLREELILIQNSFSLFGQSVLLEATLRFVGNGIFNHFLFNQLPHRIIEIPA